VLVFLKIGTGEYNLKTTLLLIVLNFWPLLSLANANPCDDLSETPSSLIEVFYPSGKDLGERHYRCADYLILNGASIKAPYNLLNYYFATISPLYNDGRYDPTLLDYLISKGASKEDLDEALSIFSAHWGGLSHNDFFPKLVEKVSLLISRGASVNPDFGPVPLLAAIYNQNQKFFDFLLSQNAKIDSTFKRPFHYKWRPCSYCDSRSISGSQGYGLLLASIQSAMASFCSIPENHGDASTLVESLISNNAITIREKEYSLYTSLLYHVNSSTYEPSKPTPQNFKKFVSLFLNQELNLKRKYREGTVCELVVGNKDLTQMLLSAGGCK
jgi:hypothetical protein